MKDILIGFFLGYWLKDKIDPEKTTVEKEVPATPNLTNENPDSSNLSAGLWLASLSLGIGLLTVLIG